MFFVADSLTTHGYVLANMMIQRLEIVISKYRRRWLFSRTMPVFAWTGNSTHCVTTMVKPITHPSNTTIYL
jgi:hypothetical protein